ncbi:MAG: hypothetical protein AAFY29_19735 [Pseudomonadota bacterium]
MAERGLPIGGSVEDFRVQVLKNPMRGLIRSGSGRVLPEAFQEQYAALQVPSRRALFGVRAVCAAYAASA